MSDPAIDILREILISVRKTEANTEFTQKELRRHHERIGQHDDKFEVHEEELKLHAGKIDTLEAEVLNGVHRAPAPYAVEARVLPPMREPAPSATSDVRASIRAMSEEQTPLIKNTAETVQQTAQAMSLIPKAMKSSTRWNAVASFAGIFAAAALTQMFNNCNVQHFTQVQSPNPVFNGAAPAPQIPPEKR